MPSVENNLALTGQADSQTANSNASIKRRFQRPLTATDNFYGHKIPVLPIADLPALDLHNPSNATIASAWAALTELNHKPTLGAIKQYQRELQLGDWALIHLTDTLLGDALKQDNDRYVFLALLLTKLGYDIKLGYSSQSVQLLFPAEQTLYGMRYNAINDVEYYIYADAGDRVIHS